MSVWRTGKFERERIPGIWHPFTPAHAIDNLHELDLQQLWDQGKRLLLIDVDNTIVQWKQENFSEPVLAWIANAKELGFDICLISNTNRVDRLDRLRHLLGVETVRGRFKPSRAMFRLAMIKFKRKPHEAIMIGDQLMTDILGANRAGIEAVWVKKMEGVEFGPTSINRKMERFFQSYIYKALVAPVDEEEAPASIELQKPVEDRAIVHQIIKFVLVGGTSFVIDYMIRMTLLFAIPWGNRALSEVVGASLRTSVPFLFGGFDSDRAAFFPIAATIAASVAIVNSFIWNRLWTFGITGRHERMRQFRRFLAVSLIGLGLNVLLSSYFNHILAFDEKWNARVATVIAALIVAIWNFAGQRMYAFRSKH
jgi:HAD superfamily phosphatase (TIGR01668 family)